MNRAFDFRLHQVSYSEVDANGFIGIQFDAFGEEKSGMPAVEAHHPFGFMSRPVDPDVDADGAPKFGCNVLVGWDGDEAHAWVLADPRSRLVLPTLLRGESIQYGAAGNFVRCHLDGRVSVFTTDDGTTTGKTVAFQVKPDGFLMNAPWGKLTFDATGFHVLHVSGARFDLGAIGGLPTPLDAISTYIGMQAGIFKGEFTAAGFGPDTGAPEPAAKALALLTFLGTITGALTSIEAALGALGTIAAGAPNSGAAVQIAAAASAINSAASALTPAALAIPSSSSQVT